MNDMHSHAANGSFIFEPIASHSLTEALEEPSSHTIEATPLNHAVKTSKNSHDQIEILLEKRRYFQEKKTENLSKYLEYTHNTKRQNSLTICHGTPFLPSFPMHTSIHQKHTGYVVTIDGKTFVINPGKNFLHYFHKAGFHLWDIDSIIVTDAAYSHYEELILIHESNRELNSLLEQCHLPPHIFSYYVHTETYPDLASKLQPKQKEEEQKLHILSTYTASRGEKKIGQNLFLEYEPHATNGVRIRFIAEPVAKQEAISNEMAVLKNSLLLPNSPIKIMNEEISNHSPGQTQERKIPMENRPLFGYTSTLSFSEEEASFFSTCKTLCFGTYQMTVEQLIDQIKKPFFDRFENAVILLTEANFSHGDLRLEMLKIIQSMLNNPEKTVLFEEEGVLLAIDTMQIHGPGLLEPTSASSCKIIRSEGPFSTMRFINTNYMA